jgi:GNAT superfamily N-acetyltransferase
MWEDVREAVVVVFRPFRSMVMPVTVLQLVCRDVAVHTDGQALHRPHIRPYVRGADEAHVLDLAGDFPLTAAERPAVRGAGLVAEMDGRAGRRVAGWLGWPPDDADSRGPVAGLVTLVEAQSAGGDARWSIGWLLVRPHMRRQGLGRELVATALAAAATAGASAVWVETDGRWSDSLAFWRAIGFQPG